ncbi:bifunctional 3'-5' exonuclease/DNA polymerase [Brevibacterium album]|uniref:bifunctional 3'-5' exonuclease/DNA polymerase n=1 Tax=Brevibacterium album TaxID=417948 RepID=UPI000417E4D6|nr:bifunctional 3'-5' exonuclease/DNA polymerase [Brevibacterium album]
MSTRWCVVGYAASGSVALTDVGADGTVVRTTDCSPEALPEAVRRRESQGGPRWVWSDTSAWYPQLLAAGVRVERCHDLRLAHAILARTAAVHAHARVVEDARWEAGPASAASAHSPESGGTLFDYMGHGGASGVVPHDSGSALAEFARHRAALEEAASHGGLPAGRLRLLLAAESAGGLIAEELRCAGIPWDAAEHDRILEADLGPRPPAGAHPARMHAVAEEVRAALGDPRADLDSPVKLLRALRRAGIPVSSTSQWELREHDHPAVEPLLRYKKLARLLTANGWTWMDAWVREGRYRPVYVPGGVVTGRWASTGGGALQIPRQLRPALRADPGWRLVSADVAQLEPRVLAAMAGDAAMARAASGADLYAGIVAAGAVASREEAKIAVLGAMYGGTTGASGRLVPRLRRTFPDAMAMVDRAAALGERGDRVSTWLGRTSPSGRLRLEDAETERERREAREQGRFTRNFIVQGTAAEWALAWMALLRSRLAALPETEEAPAEASGPVFSRRAHLAFFLHDEVIVHAPADQAEAAAEAVRACAAEAGRLLFGSAPVDFPLDLRVAERSES